MPDITYAVVSSDSVPADTATAERDLLTNLVTYSHSGDLPPGYSPLPDALYQAALASIKTAVVAQPSTTPTTQPTTTTTTPSSSSGGSGSSDGSTLPYDYSNIGDNYANAPFVSDQGATVPSSSNSNGSQGQRNGNGNGNGNGTTAGAVPADLATVAFSTEARYLLVALMLLALACLIGGPLLAFGLPARRRARHRTGRS